MTTWLASRCCSLAEERKKKVGDAMCSCTVLDGESVEKWNGEYGGKEDDQQFRQKCDVMQSSLHAWRSWANEEGEDGRGDDIDARRRRQGISVSIR